MNLEQQLRIVLTEEIRGMSFDLKAAKERNNPMRIINEMPFEKCENCQRCILTVVDNNTVTGERAVYVSCKKARKCMKDGRANRSLFKEGEQK